MTPLDGDLERITLWVQVVTGMELDPHVGKVHVLDVDTWQRRRTRLDELRGAPSL